jgi:glycosyltransferase involved in cell wall biosynthesis
MTTPLVSILLPSYKNAPRLRRAIESILEQSFTDWELIIIDDGLDGDAAQIVEGSKYKDPRILSIKNKKNLGIQKSLNFGLQKAQGEYIARIDDDDEWIDKEKLMKQVSFLEKNEDYVLVGTNANIVGKESRNLGVYNLPEKDMEIRKRILSKNCFIHSSILARKKSVLRMGGYDETLKVCHIEDYALWLKLGLLGKFANLDLVGVKIRIHPGSLTFQNRVIQSKNMFRLIRDYSRKYPNFILASILLGLRLITFLSLKLIPVPEKIVYKVQKIYKDF